MDAEERRNTKVDNKVEQKEEKVNENDNELSNLQFTTEELIQCQEKDPTATDINESPRENICFFFRNGTLLPSAINVYYHYDY